jgi:hypothetical protein
MINKIGIMLPCLWILYEVILGIEIQVLLALCIKCFYVLSKCLGVQ